MARRPRRATGRPMDEEASATATVAGQAASPAAGASAAEDARDRAVPTAADGGGANGSSGGSAAAEDSALLGAYALGALSPEARAAVEERLAASPALQDELRRLIPVAALLREASDTPSGPAPSPAPPPAARDAAPAPSSVDRPPPDDEIATSPSVDVPDSSGFARDLEGPGSLAVPTDPDGDLLARDGSGDVGERPSAERTPAGDEDEPLGEGRDGGDTPVVTRVEATPGSLSSAPPRRRRPAAEPRPARTSGALGSWPPSWIAAGVATVVAVAAVLWALAMVDRLDTRQREVDALTAELATLRARGDAAVVALTSPEGSPAGADGVAVVVPTEGSLLVRVGGLPASAEGRVYQVWIQAEPDGPWIVGPVFRVGETGTVLTELAAAVPSIIRLAISDEPSPGSDQPTGPFLLDGTVPPAS